MDTLEEVKYFSRSAREREEISPIKIYTDILVSHDNQGRVILPWDPLALKKQGLEPFITQEIYTGRQQYEDRSKQIEKVKAGIDVSLISDSRSSGQKKTYTSTKLTQLIKELGGKVPTGATKSDLVKILKSILGLD